MRQTDVADTEQLFWINQRIRSIEVRKELTDEWKRGGVEEGVQYASLTDVITKEWSGRTVISSAKASDYLLLSEEKPVGRISCMANQLNCVNRFASYCFPMQIGAFAVRLIIFRL